MGELTCDTCGTTDDVENCINCFYGGDYCPEHMDDHYHNDYECQCFVDWDEEEDDSGYWKS